MNSIVKYIALIAVVITTVTSCAKSDDVSVKSVNSVSIVESKESNVVFNVNVNTHNAASQVVLKTVELEFKTVGSTTPFAALYLTDKVKIPRGNAENVDVNIAVNISGGLLGSISVVNMLRRGKLDAITVSGYMKFRNGLLSGKYKLKETPLDQLLNTMGIDYKDLITK